MKKSGEKCQIASFGQSSRRPPPAKPQPTAKGSATHSPANSGGSPSIDADDGAGVGSGEQSGEEGARQREVGAVVVEEQARRSTPAVERNAEAGREDEPFGPVALLGQQDPPEPRKPHQHRRQHGPDRELRHEREEQVTLGREVSCVIEVAATSTV